jgi:meso-butanediol dehydrogenase / (S,S)-butanediol dehydrogenase / diacetyl reductase
VPPTAETGTHSDRLALVTGGASGIGLACARLLALRGARVAVADRDADRLDALAVSDPHLVPIEIDVGQIDQIRNGVDDVVTRFGGLDVLVIGAAIAVLEPIDEVTPASWDLTLSVNLRGAFFVCQAAAAALRASGRGRIVTISSAAGRRGYAATHAYGASKFGLVGLTESLAAELAGDHVTVNCVCPATCPTTAMGQTLLRQKAATTGRSEADILRDLAARYPLGRCVEEHDIAEAVAFLASDAASFLTGITIDVAGGEGLGRRAEMSSPISGASSPAGWRDRHHRHH